MRKNIIRMSLVAVMTVLGIGMVAVPSVMAEEEEEVTEYRTSLTISPASKTLELKSKMTEEDVLSITNDGNKDITVEVYAAPYSYTYSEEDDEYRLGYSHENSFTQLSRWIKIKNKDGVYESKTTFKIKPGATEQVNYRIATPDDIPAGGQYAVIFAQVKSSDEVTGAIRADPSLGMIIYGRSNEGEVVVSSELRDLKLGQGVKTEGDSENEVKKTIFYGSAKVKNTGNVDFFAQGILEVTPIIGFSSYRTPSNQGTVSVIPETEMTVSDQWEEMPDFGIYKATWTVTGGNETQTIEQMIFLIPPIAVILLLLVLTIIIIGVIMLVKRRKAKKSRLAI